MTDIHCHILPGIDDGPPDMPTSIEMARAAVESGISTIAATPHLRADFPNVKVDEIGDRVQELRDGIAAEGIELEIVARIATLEVAKKLANIWGIKMSESAKMIGITPAWLRRSGI